MRGWENDYSGDGTFILSSWLFLRLLGVIYGIAFASLGTQILGLVGRNGISPATDFLRGKKQLWETDRFHLYPTLCWWKVSDGFLQFLCWGGVGLSVLLIVGVAPVPVLILLWAFYLSLFTVCRVFLGYQWDVLLLETGFLAIFLAPFEIRPVWPPSAAPLPVVQWLLYWLLFRLMFSSGVGKLRSGDRTWRTLTALKYHYETQPLPTSLGWLAHQLPGWFHKISVVIMFVIELLIPFLIFAPSPLCYVAGAAIVILMLLIMATGNYCFFNLLAIALCVLLFDDGIYQPVFHALFPGWKLSDAATSSSTWPIWLVLPLAAIILFLSVDRCSRLFHREFNWPKPLETLHNWLRPFCLVNGYGLFSIMTSSRPEIIVEGSNDGKNWLAYEFKWKPGDVKQPPRFVAPHQPRLDWQVWFAALSDYHANPWFRNFLMRLLQGKTEVLALLKKSPFPEAPPQYVRATLYDYRFTKLAVHRAHHARWQRKLKWPYSPVLSQRGVEEKFTPLDAGEEEW